MSITRIQKWGNSYGLRIPKNIIEELDLQADSRLDIRQEEGKIVITPVREPGITLEDLLDQVTPENLHDEADWGAPAGKEAW